MKISIIAAITENLALGKDNDLLFRIPEDLKRFKRITTGHCIVMGKKTYYSLPLAPLPGRKNIVITRDAKENFPGCTVVHSVEEAIDQMDQENENFIIGGGTVYKEFIPRSDTMYITWIHENTEDADTFFPKIEFDEWVEIERHKPDFSNQEPVISFVIYKRKNG